MIDWTKVIITADDDTVSEASGQVILLASGVPGESASVEVVETVTLDPLEDADVENVGDSRNVKLKFKIPRGQSGVWGGIGGTLEDQADLKHALDAKADIIHTSASGSLVHITDGAAYPVDALNVSIDPVQAGSGDPSPDNVRPISGHSTATVTRTGKNLWDKANAVWYRNNSSNFSETADNSTTRIRSNSLPIRCGGKTITVSGLPSGITLLQIRFFDKNQNKISEVITSATATAPNGTEYLHLLCGGSDFTSQTNQDMENANLQLELDSTATAYESPHVQTVTIALGDTYYGAQLDAVAGTLTVDRAMIALDNRGTWAKSNSYPGGFYLDINTGIVLLYGVQFKRITPFICSHAKTVNSLEEYVEGTCYCDNSINIRIMQAETTSEQWGQYLQDQYDAGTPVQICGYLASPTTVSLTPAQISLLLGENNVWSDTGDTTVGYRADTKLYIDSKLAAAIAELQALILEH